MKIQSILCPIDMSPDSDKALLYAIALARAYAAQLILLHCDLHDPRLASSPAAMDEVFGCESDSGKP